MKKTRPIQLNIKALSIIISPEPRNDWHHTSAASASTGSPRAMQLSGLIWSMTPTTLVPWHPFPLAWNTAKQWSATIPQSRLPTGPDRPSIYFTECIIWEQTLQRRPQVKFKKRGTTWRERVWLLWTWGRNAPASTSPTPFRLHFNQIKWRQCNACVAFRNGACAGATHSRPEMGSVRSRPRSSMLFNWPNESSQYRR